jgi:N-acetylglucosaminyl-diphospho-decaprenol L-rhamnosyltransferase
MGIDTCKYINFFSHGVEIAGFNVLRASTILMELSIIIVNYRVAFFLELCLFSVEKAIGPIEAEILVVDNHSGDGSIEYLRPKFPRVQFIANQENRGFGAANNQALEKARGRYILFLNPDTILPEDFITTCLSFLDSIPRIGGLGVRMVDGSGLFLKESLRGFPSAWVAFCKLSGLTALFPRSRLFAGYYLGHVSPALSQRAPVLSGACLWVSRSVLDEVGGFDEQFFMYAEDIDLSYRIGLAGYHNYYLADTTIVHFKGESTQKDSRYVKLFYKAMSQFRRKHFRGGFHILFNIAVEAGIWLRAGITALSPSISPSDRRRPSPSDQSPDNASIRSFLAGDPREVEYLSERLASSGKRLLAADAAQAGEIIFCEGKAFSFRQAISALEASALRPNSLPVRFYAAGSGSVTGSASKDGRGETIVL